MAMLKTAKHSRVRRWGVIIGLSLIAYFFWPNQQIENLSNHLVADQKKNDYLDAILNPKLAAAHEQSDSIYSEYDGPVKAIFDPADTNLNTPDEINIEKMQMAMDKLKLASPDQLNEDLGDSAILSDIVLNAKYSPTELKAFVGNHLTKKQDYYTDLTCSEIQYIPKSKDETIEYSDPVRLEDDFFEIKDLLMASKYQKLVSVVDESSADGSMISDIKHWYKKAGSSVWLPFEQLHMVATTVMYAPHDVNDPMASFIRLQLFDANWVEVKDRRIKYKDLSDNDIHNTLKSYNKSKDDHDLDSISLKFPSILNISIDTKIKKNVGAENPRMIFKNGDFFSEPVIIFNMATSSSKRSMFAIFPFRKPYGSEKEHKVLKFKNIGKNALTHLKEEKNWVPFFDTVRVGDSKRSRGNIHFVYTMDPLVVFRCSLDSGNCSKLQDNIKSSSYSTQSEAYLRGGTSFTPVPKEVIMSLTGGDKNKRIQMWVGFQRFNVKKSMCGTSFQRPTLTLLVKEDGIFRVEMITAPLDFGLKSGEICDPNTPSIIHANDIAFWDVKRSDSGSASVISSYEDHMGVIIDTQNEKVEILFLKNVLNYILGIYSNGNLLSTDFDFDDNIPVRSRKVGECSLESAVKFADDLSNKKKSQAVAKIVE